VIECLASSMGFMDESPIAGSVIAHSLVNVSSRFNNTRATMV
jgi:hypothetical protein